MALRLIISDKAQQRSGSKIILLIEENTERGVDRFGRPFAPYSDRRFARPVGGIPQTALGTLKKSNGLTFINRGEGKKKWVVIHGGYIALKRAWRPAAGGAVDLTLRGLMMRDLMVLSSGNGRIIIGFQSAQAATEAFYHVVAGAGKARTIRDFLGITDEQWEQVAELLGDGDGITFDGTI